MKIKILVFGSAKEIIKTSSFAFGLKKEDTVLEFKKKLTDNFPKLTQLNSYAIAVNETYANDNLILKENDIIAIIPPVSGG